MTEDEKMNIYSLPSLGAFIISLVLGVYILGKDTRNKFNRYFFIFTLAVSIWVLGKFMKRADIGVGSPDLWSIVENIGAIFVAPLMLLFVSLLQPATNPSLFKKSYFWLTIYGLCGVFLVLLFSGNLIGEVIPGLWGHEYSIKPAFVFFGIYFLALIFISIARLFRIFSISDARDVIRKQSGLIFMGLVFAAVLTAFADVVFPIAEIDFMPMTSIGLIFFELLISYAVAKHKLLTIPQIRRFFTPVPEAFLKTEMKYKLEKGYNYMFREKEPNQSADLFLDQVTHGVIGFWITSLNQKKPDQFGIRKTPVLFLTNAVILGVASHPIDKLKSLITLVNNELSLVGEKMLIMVDCFEDIALVNTFKQATAFMHKLSKTCSSYSSSIIVRADADRFTKKQLDMLEKALAPVRVNIKMS